MHYLDFHREWEQHHGKIVTVDGKRYKIKTMVYKAVYPVTCWGISVHAEMVDKNCVEYRDTKRELGDDWSTDLLDSDVTIECKFLKAARRVGQKTINYCHYETNKLPGYPTSC